VAETRCKDRQTAPLHSGSLHFAILAHRSRRYCDPSHMSLLSSSVVMMLSFRPYRTSSNDAMTWWRACPRRDAGAGKRPGASRKSSTGPNQARSGLL